MATSRGRTTAQKTSSTGRAKTQKKPAPAAKRAPARSSSSRGTPPKPKGRDLTLDLVALGIGVLGVLVVLATWFSALGPVGHGLDEFLGRLFGLGRELLGPLCIAAAIALVLGKPAIGRVRLAVGSVLAMVSICGLAHLFGSSPSLSASTSALSSAGGLVGAAVGVPLSRALGALGAGVIFFAIGVVSVVVLTGMGVKELASRCGAALSALFSLLKSWWIGKPLVAAEPKPEKTKKTPAVPAEAAVTVAAPVVPAARNDDPFDGEAVITNPVEKKAPAKKQVEFETERMVGDWKLPPVSLLSLSKEHRHDQRQIEAGGEALVAALGAHGVDTRLVGYTVGPTVTRYELELGSGVKVARVTSLHKDIAYAMASPDVRILAPIPGRSAIGVEVPNRQRQLVALGDILTSKEAAEATHPLEVALGRDIAGRAVLVNLAEMPHVLISGATGSGKSSCINSLITSILIRSTPDQVRMILIDPKRVELGQYNDLPHLLAPVVVDPKKAANALSWAVKEMERRYDLLAEFGVRDITGYNESFDAGTLSSPRRPNDKARINAIAKAAKAQAAEITTGPLLESDEDDDDLDLPVRLPFIVVVVDELNDLMMVAARDVEESVVRIAQMARAVGIHLVLATQRPSVDVITGVIKANVPSRMAFSVSSLADSRVILDQPGAERLIGKGDMLLLTASSNVARRIQGPWVDEDEVRQIVAFWKRQGGSTEAVVAISDEGPRRTSGARGAEDDDELLQAAIDLVVKNQMGSTSMLQRSLRVGFARAGRLMDTMEQRGIVGPADGSKVREVLMTADEIEMMG